MIKPGTKTLLWSIGGLALATGLFFGIRALVKSGSERRDKKLELERLRRLNEEDELSESERERLAQLEKWYEQGDGELKSDNVGGCAFPLGNNSGGSSGCKEVAQIQLAINQKHSNNTADYKGSFADTYCCTGSDCDSKLAVDGTMGPCTMKAIKKYYGYCCECKWALAWGGKKCDCIDCSISTSNYKSIISGADVSDEALASAGFDVQSSFSGFQGSGYMNFTLSDREQLRGQGPLEWRDQQGPLGDFYPGMYDFTDDNPPVSNLKHNYGMGRGFGFNGYSNQSGRQHIGLPIGVAPIWGCTDPQALNYNSLANTNDGSCIYKGRGEEGQRFSGGESNGNEYISYTNFEGQTGSESEILTWNDFVEDVP